MRVEIKYYYEDFTTYIYILLTLENKNSTVKF